MQSASRQFLILNVFLLCLAQLVGLVVLHRPGSPYLQELLSGSERWIIGQNNTPQLPIEMRTAAAVPGLKPGYDASNFVLVKALKHGEPTRLVWRRKGQFWLELWSAQASYFLPLLALFLLSFGATLAFYLRAKGKAVEEVMAEMGKGNLSARLPMDAFDSDDSLIQRFNVMAEKIEKLVGQLAHAETSRSQMLRELAHDIRTPLTSIRFLIETVADTAPELSFEKIREKLSTADQEMTYFENLIEELFLLAQVSVPGYQVRPQLMNLLEVARQEVAHLEKLREAWSRDAEVSLVVDAKGSWSFSGDAPLIQRLLRNSLENALHYAKSKVELHLTKHDGSFELIVRDDGKGFSEEGLKAFGTRRKSRYLDTSREGKASLGLGSVIVSTIAHSHGGSVHAGNWKDSKAGKSGGEVRVVLPYASRGEEVSRTPTMLTSYKR